MLEGRGSLLEKKLKIPVVGFDNEMLIDQVEMLLLDGQ